jgi:hypothetical protein
VVVVDKQKKQIIIVIALSVLALGAGSYFVLGRSGGNAAAKLTQSGPVERKVRDTSTTEKKAGTRKEGTKKDKEKTAAPTVERKEKRKTETKSSSGRKERGTREKKEKKKTDAPMG